MTFKIVCGGCREVILDNSYSKIKQIELESTIENGGVRMSEFNDYFDYRDMQKQSQEESKED